MMVAVNGHRIIGLGTAALLALAGGCGDDNKPQRLPWKPDQTTVISNGGSADTVNALPSETCVVGPDAPADACIDASIVDRCDAGETTTEVVVDENGEVLDVVCIPPDVEAVEAIDLADGEIDQSANSTALIFEGEDPTFDGDLTVDGNKVILYGESPEDATIDGTLTLEGNNSVVRGVTITGDLVIAKNNPVVVYCVVQGNVRLEANNARVSGCDIWGDVIVSGNNQELHGNRIAGKLQVTGKNTVCSGNLAFADENEDGVIQDDEVGEALSCD